MLLNEFKRLNNLDDEISELQIDLVRLYQERRRLLNKLEPAKAPPQSTPSKIAPKLHTPKKRIIKVG